VAASKPVNSKNPSASEGVIFDIFAFIPLSLNWQLDISRYISALGWTVQYDSTLQEQINTNSFWRFYYQVVMIVHETICMTEPAKAVAGLL